MLFVVADILARDIYKYLRADYRVFNFVKFQMRTPSSGPIIEHSIFGLLPFIGCFIYKIAGYPISARGKIDKKENRGTKRNGSRKEKRATRR